MKKSKRRFIAAVMALCLSSISCPPLIVSAVGEENVKSVQTEITRRFSYIIQTDAVFDSSGDFVAIINSDSRVESIYIKVELQKKGLFGYSTVDTLSDTFYDSDVIYEDSFNLDSSETYRIKVTFEVFTADDDESTVQYAYA